MFDFEPLTEEQLIEEAKLESRYHAWRSKEALSIFVELRKELCNAFVSLDIVVLKPICLNCRYQAIGQEWPDAPHPEIVRIWPELTNGRLRLYEAAGQSVEFWPADDGEAEFHNSCFQCKQPLTLGDVTLDHIVARAQGGEAVPLNLQVLCEACNQRKKDIAVVTMEIALDFPLRPAPSDSYEELIW